MSYKIVILGTCGSGKTTLAKQLAEKYSLVHQSLDELHFLPNWVERSDEDFRKDVQSLVDKNNNWIAEGNYAVLRDILWENATHIIWLNYPFLLNFWRVFSRAISRSITKEPVCNGNTENFKMLFFTKDSILYWFFKTYWSRRKEYPLMLKEWEEKGKLIVELKSQKEANNLIVNNEL